MANLRLKISMKFSVWIFFMAIFCVAHTQENEQSYTLIINDVSDKQLSKLHYSTFKSIEAAREQILKVRNYHVKKGYVLANLDSIVQQEGQLLAFYFQGPKFENISILISDDDRFLLRKIPRLSEKYLRNINFEPREVARMLQAINTYLENNGYPFARVRLTGIDLNPEHPKAELTVDYGANVRIKSVHLKGEANVNKQYVTNFIAIKEGDEYNEQRFSRITQRIRQIPFIDEIKPHEILFTPEGAEAFLYLKSNPVSLINGVLGLQPNPVTGQNVITGDVRLKLQNAAFNRGELLDVNWRSLQPQTQDLQMHLNYPFLFNSPFGADFEFELYRRDSTFLTTIVDLGAQYFMRGGNYLKIFFEAENSNLLSGAGNNFSLPNTNFSSVSSNRYGLGLFRRQIDYLPNPSKGFEIDIDGLVGRRSSRRLNADTSLVNTTYTLRMDINAYLPLAKRHVMRLANRTRAYFAPEVYVNELHRFGGLTTQRGFDEEELFASTLTTFTLEYRFLVDRNSHAFFFYDQSFYENVSAAYYRDFPFGVGAGFSFGTNIGVFSITYAVGKQFDNPILLRNGKVHFGYVSFF